MATPVSSPPPSPEPEPEKGDEGRAWMLMALTMVFVALWAVTFLGWINPLPERVMRLEAIIGVIIGYYFGRVPGEKNEKTLKEQVAREARKAGEAEEKKEQAQWGEGEAEKRKEALEQKVRSTKALLTGAVPGGVQGKLPANLGGGDASAAGEDALRHNVAAALRVLDS